MGSQGPFRATAPTMVTQLAISAQQVPLLAFPSSLPAAAASLPKALIWHIGKSYQFCLLLASPGYFPVTDQPFTLSLHLFSPSLPSTTDYSYKA